ncbi:MAG TPA: hypothetical protein VKM93_04065 [Terriglobia bacterium]|nr:hypothetical protein [Terriglobia bacterium]
MAITMTPSYQFVEETWVGTTLRNAKLAVTNLPANSLQVVAHGLPSAPIIVGLEPKSNSTFWEYQPADATNIYVGIGAASGTHAVDIYVTY